MITIEVSSTLKLSPKAKMLVILSKGGQYVAIIMPIIMETETKRSK